VTRLEIAALTDTGKVREANEDAVWTGDSVVAVADGMGGHAAGEVASATALEPVARLDGKVFANAHEARDALARAIVEANVAVVRKAAHEPTYRGMGTTLTAAMFEGRRVHVAHVGDSRAYLLRNGELMQLTTDHTLVQHLIDEGELDPTQAATHPHRSVVTRAIGVSADVDVDSLTIDLHVDDQLLLCSDGLTGVVADSEIARTLLEFEHDAPAAARSLVDLANAAGGPDNITIILLRFHAEAEEPVAVHDETSQLMPAPVVVTPDRGPPSGDWAQRLGRLGRVGEARADDGPRVTPLQRWTAIVIALAVLGIATLGGGRWLLSRSYYVGLDGEQVVIYQGVPIQFGPIDLSWISEPTPLTTGDVAEFYVRRLTDGIPATDLDDARRIVESAPQAGEDSPPASGRRASVGP